MDDDDDEAPPKPAMEMAVLVLTVSAAIALSGAGAEKIITSRRRRSWIAGTNDVMPDTSDEKHAEQRSRAVENFIALLLVPYNYNGD